MGARFHILGILAVTLWTDVSAWADAPRTSTGFLVVAQDRGFLGNEEIRSLVADFAKEYPAALALVGRDYNGVEGEYAQYLSTAVHTLKTSGVTELVAIPLFVSNADPLLPRLKQALPAYGAGLPIRWASAMADDYLTAQIVLDRVGAASQDPRAERLVLIGTGAMDEASAQAITQDLTKLAGYVARYKRFIEIENLVYYDREADDAEQKNQAVKARLTGLAAKPGRTLVVPAFIGPKFDHMMSLTSWLERQWRETRVVFSVNELLPHPNALLWLRKTANRELPARSGQIGVVIMPHGSTQPWNDAVERVLHPLKEKYQIEMAYGMGDPHIIQTAVSNLDRRGIRRIVFVRLYALEHHMKAETDYILGVTDQPPGTEHGGEHGHAAPPQIRTSALFSTFGGYEESPEIAGILHKRIEEVSQEPSKETVLLVAHGDGSDQGNAHWLSVMNRHIEVLRKDPHCAGFKAITAVTVREDWPAQREQAVAEARATIATAGKEGRVLVVSDRLYGSGPYKKMFRGLTYELNEKGLLDPILTRWIENGLRQHVTELHARTGEPARPGQP